MKFLLSAILILSVASVSAGTFKCSKGSNTVDLDFNGSTVQLAGKKGVSSAPVLQVTDQGLICLLYTSPSPRDQRGARMPSSA